MDKKKKKGRRGPPAPVLHKEWNVGAPRADGMVVLRAFRPQHGRPYLHTLLLRVEVAGSGGFRAVHTGRVRVDGIAVADLDAERLHAAIAQAKAEEDRLLAAWDEARTGVSVYRTDDAKDAAAPRPPGEARPRVEAPGQAQGHHAHRARKSGGKSRLKQFKAAPMVELRPAVEAAAPLDRWVDTAFGGDPVLAEAAAFKARLDEVLEPAAETAAEAAPEAASVPSTPRRPVSSLLRKLARHLV